MVDRLKALIEDEINKSLVVLSRLLSEGHLASTLPAVVSDCVQAIARGGKLLLAGNGGSAADCQHLAAELIGRLCRERGPIPALALTADTSVLTALGNDYGFEEVFARQVEGLGRPGDVLFAISTSGRSKNVLKAIDAARGKGMKVVGLTGINGFSMAQLCDHCLVIPSAETQKIQEGHITVGHILCAAIEDTFAKGGEE